MFRTRGAGPIERQRPFQISSSRRAHERSFREENLYDVTVESMIIAMYRHNSEMYV